MQPCARAGIPRRQTPALSVAGDRLLVGLIGRTDSRSRGGVRIRSALTRFGRLTALCVTRRVSPVRRTQRCTPSWRTTHRAALVAAARERTPPSTALGYACARRVRLPTLLCVSSWVRVFARVHVSHAARTASRRCCSFREHRDFMSAAASAPSGPACSRTLGPRSTLLHDGMTLSCPK